MKKLLLAALAVLCGAQMASGAADQVRDGESFNTPNCVRLYVRRSVDSTGTVAGRKDSAVVVCSPNVMPTPMAVGGTDDSDTTSVVFRFDTSNNLKTSEQSKDRDLDFGVTNLFSSVAIDTGGVGGTNFRYSAPVDVRKYGKGKINIIVHIIPAAADTAVASGYWYDLGVAVFPLKSAQTDWGTATNLTTASEGVPYVPIFAAMGTAGADSVGSFGTVLAPNSANLGPGERRLRFSATRPANGNGANVASFHTITLPLSYWVGDVQPRYLVVQLRHMQKATGATGSPTIRVDLEGLR